MSTPDTRAKLETLFRRMTDPATSDIEAMEACIWFRKEALKDVAQALGPGASGASHAPASTATVDNPILAKTPTFGKYGPKREGGAWTWARILRDDPGYVPSLLELDDPAPWMVKIVHEVLGIAPPSTTAAKPNRNADYLRQEAQSKSNIVGNPDATGDEPPF